MVVGAGGDFLVVVLDVLVTDPQTQDFGYCVGEVIGEKDAVLLDQALLLAFFG